LSKEAPGLKAIFVGLGWDARPASGEDFDLDASAFLLNAASKTRGSWDFIFYNQLESRDKSIVHMGDNRTGAGAGDNEIIKIDLAGVDKEIQSVAFTVTIHDAERRRQNFGMVSNAFIRVVNQEGDTEIARFDLSEDMSTETAMIFGEIYRSSGEWKFKAVGQGFSGGLAVLARRFGVNV
jgi:tellurium resistance protein TerD